MIYLQIDKNLSSLSFVYFTNPEVVDMLFNYCISANISFEEHATSSFRCGLSRGYIAGSELFNLNATKFGKKAVLELVDLLSMFDEVIAVHNESGSTIQFMEVINDLLTE